MASGVSTGNSRSMNQASSQVRSVSDSSSGSVTLISASARRSRRSSQVRACAAIRLRARASTSVSCWAGVRPSGDGVRTPAFA